MKDNIDDLLSRVSGKLIAGYEKINGVNLRAVNEEYKKACSFDAHKAVKMWFRFSITILVILTVVGFTFIIHYNRPVTGILIMACAYILIMIRSRCLDERIAKANASEDRCLPRMKKFQSSLAALDPMGIRSEYTENSVYDDLVGCAVRILDAEVKFDAACSAKEKVVSDILHLGHFLEKCRENRLDMLDAVKKFGLEFSNSAIFADARKHIERTEERIAAAKMNSQ